MTMASRSTRIVEETLHRRGTTLVRRLILGPGEATRWHTDPLHRVSVVLKGEALRIEFRDGGEDLCVNVARGQVDWSEPGDRGRGVFSSPPKRCTDPVNISRKHRGSFGRSAYWNVAHFELSQFGRR